MGLEYTSPSAAMDATVAQLRFAQLQVLTRVNDTATVSLGSWEIFGSGTSKVQAIGAVNKEADIINRLDNVLRRQVMSGEMTYAQWQELAKVSWDALTYYDASIGEFGAYGVLASTASATKKDIKEKVAEIGDDSFPFLTVGTIALIALLLLTR